MNKLSFLVVIALCFSVLVSCSGGISREEADSVAMDLISKLQEDDLTSATALMHPSTNTTEDYFGEFIKALEAGVGIDFSELTNIELRRNFSSSLYSSDVGGARYEINYKLTQDDKTFNCAVEIIKADDVVGIYNIVIKAE